MTADVTVDAVSGPGADGVVRVVRPVGVRQVSAALAVAAAVAALTSVGTSLDRTSYFSEGEEYQTVVRLGTGDQLRESFEGSPTDALAWAGPAVLAAVLLTAAAVAALLAARSDRPGGWGAAAQQLAAGGAGVLAALTAVLVVVGVSDVSAHRTGEGIVTRWGPAPIVLLVAVGLALAAAVTARRGRARVLATIGAGA
ncbi:hypothetical protein [Blastococcus sp. SYSU D00813]